MESSDAAKKKTVVVQVQFSTFLKWGVTDTIGHRTETQQGKVLVTEVWCKLCREHAVQIQLDSRLRGQAKKEIDKYVNGTSFVSKYTELLWTLKVGRYITVTMVTYQLPTCSSS